MVLIFTANFGFSQNMYNTTRTSYLTIQGGPSKYLGDVGGHPSSFANKIAIDKNTYFFGASFYRLYYRKFAFELGFASGKLTASDNDIEFISKEDPEYQRYRRNLDFRTNITEGHLHLHFFPLQYNQNVALKKFPLQPFFYGGVGYYSFNPEGTYFDPLDNKTVWTALQPLHTEGQGYAEYPDRKPYNLTQVNIPYGFGATYFMAENLFISVSMNNRKLFTDYLDDVSTNYIDTRLHSKYLTYQDEIDNAVYMSDKTGLVDPFYKVTVGEKRGNTPKMDSFFNYNIKIGMRIAKKRSKKPTYYKYDDTEICD